MTTLIGICSDNKKEVVLASDRQRSVTDKYGKIEYKLPAEKLYVSRDRNVALGTVGVFDERAEGLIGDILAGRVDIQRVIADERMPRLLELNLDRLEGKKPDLDKCTGFILATRFGDVPSLFSCYPLGKVEPREVIFVGSGSTYVDEYLKAEKVIQLTRPEVSMLGEISPQVVREVAYRAVRYAARFDPGSEGLDMMRILPDKIVELGRAIAKQEDLAQKRILNLLRE